jgi:hypothetical protein
VVDETGGSWGTAQEVPCAAAGYCAAGGDSSGGQAFVVNEASATSTSISLSAPAVTYGDEQAGQVSVTVTSQDGTPGGTVTVNSGAATVCTITLASGSGSCPLPATGLPGPVRLS